MHEVGFGTALLMGVGAGIGGGAAEFVSILLTTPGPAHILASIGVPVSADGPGPTIGVFSVGGLVLGLNVGGFVLCGIGALSGCLLPYYLYRRRQRRQPSR